MNTQDVSSIIAVRDIIPVIEKVIERIIDAYPKGGRIVYVGAGSSARVACMDAAECPPTYGISSDRITVLIAGGEKVLIKASEISEDNENDGKEAANRLNPTRYDCFIGIAASGTTPYVIAALKAAKEKGSYCVMMSANPIDETLDFIDERIEVITGPEVVTGSTRLKATTAFKLVLNMISTVSYIKLGRTYGNYMAYMKPTNNKLKTRAAVTIADCCGISNKSAEALLMKSDNDIAVALVAGLTQITPKKAKSILEKNNGFIRKAVEEGIPAKLS